MEQVLYKLPDGWEWMQLGEALDVRDGTHDSPKYVESGFPLVTSKNITGKGLDVQNVKYISKEDFDAINKRSKVDVGDILFAMIGTIGFPTVITDEPNYAIKNVALFKKRQDDQNMDFFKYFLESPYAIESMLAQAKGAAQKFVGLKVLRSFNVPLPPKVEQKRIVEKLDALLTRIDTAIEHLQQSVTLADALYASELASVFSSGQDKWPLRELNEVAEVARGKSKHRPRNDKSLFGGEYPFIQTGDVRGAQKYITNFSATYNEKGLQQSKLWPKDTICLTIAANIGDVAILGMDACFPDSVVGISSSELETDYLYYFLTTLQQQLDSKANAAAQKNINLKILSEIKIPVPSLDEQKSIVRQINEIDRLAVKAKAEISEKITTMQQLKASILDSAFKGEL
ncbi:restriction endonuclease subunit S [Shewanella basaltis]|uniref:restriction endonuclease subunit S n=1 Tax=Gammaproteobacteria TaxID=1236 RepID=UPI000E68D199|nr:restriction endonuclease subunit S [Vibrio cholerae]GIA51091.1 Type I restriction-modification system specificity [Vibrio cholerae]